MQSPSDVSTPKRVGDLYELTIPAGWGIGRGTFGGLVIGALTRAIELHVGDRVRKVRSVTAEIPMPVQAGPCEIRVEVLRAGSSVSTVRAVLTQGGAIKAHAVGVLAATRRGEGPAWQELEPPKVPSWRTLDTTALETTHSAFAVPEFAQNFEYRPLEGLPFSGGAARCVGWVRPRAHGGLRDAAHIASMIDVWWPATMVRLDKARPAATIAFTLDVIAGLDGLDPEAPLLYRGTVPVCADGYFLETRELWGEDGRLVALNQQTFALIA